MDIDAYLRRIDYAGPLAPDLATLRGLHRAHLLAVPYENLDVQLGRPLTPNPQDAFDKIVGRHRGGWCYEMNGVFGLALEALGFRVTRLAGAVMRERFGARTQASHLVLRVDLDEPWLADVGYGDGPIEPFRPRPGRFEQVGHGFDCTLVEDGWLRFQNPPYAPRSFDIRLDAADEAELAAKCASLQSDLASIFQQNAIVQRHTGGELLMLRNRVLRRVGATGETQTRLESAEAFVAALRETFGLDLPEAAALWPRICAQQVAADEAAAG